MYRFDAVSLYKAFAKRQKSDVADAEAIFGMAQLRTIEQGQAAVLTLRTRDLLIRNRIQLTSALGGHRGEFGPVAPYGA